MENKQIEIDVVKVFKVLFSKIWVIIAITCVFMLGPIYMHFFTKKVYKTSFVITSYFMRSNPKEIDFGNKYLSANSIVKSISQFNQVYNFKKAYKYTDKDTLMPFVNLKDIETLVEEDNTSIQITLSLYNPKEVNSISNALILFLNGNEYFKSIERTEKSKLEKLKSEYDKKISEMELVKQIVYNSSGGTTNFYNFNLFNDIAEMQNKSLDLESRINAYKGFEFITRPLIPLDPENGLAKYILLFFVGGFLSGSLIVLILNYKDNA